MVTVVMTTYVPLGSGHDERKDYCIQTATHLGIMLSGTDVNLHIADDSIVPDEDMLNTIKKLDLFKNTTYTNSQHCGIGASLNKALTVIEDNIWMYCTDDWVLKHTLDLQPALRLITEHDYEMVRVGPLHPNLQCTTRHHDGMWWLDFNVFSGGFVFATRPFVATKAFWQRIGQFKEHVDAYDTEHDYANRVSYMGAKVAGLLHCHNFWTHVGAYEVGHVVPG